MVDDLARKNGYKPLRPVPLTRTSRRNNKPSDLYKVPLKLPYVSEEVSSKIRSYIKKKKLAVRPIFTPGRTLSQIFASPALLTRDCARWGILKTAKSAPLSPMALVTRGTWCIEWTAACARISTKGKHTDPATIDSVNMLGLLIIPPHILKMP